MSQGEKSLNLNIESPPLAQPGAGIPGPERWLANLGLRVYARFASKESVLGLFRREAELAIGASSRFVTDEGRRPVLIKRIFGIEDSSRFWSVFMVLEHLVLVNYGIMQIIQDLCAKRSQIPRVRIEDVKPHHEAGAEQLDRLAETVESYATLIRGLNDLRTPGRHSHPWFGPLDAREWHALAAIHNRLHRRQIEYIIRVMSR